MYETQRQENKQECSFTTQQLQTIINSYLGMDPYASTLLQVLPTDRKKYSLSQIQQCLNSTKFYQLIPLYVGCLLTTTNVRIIMAALQIVGSRGTNNISQRIPILRKFSLAITLITIYQQENNMTFVPDSLTTINSILKDIGYFLTQKKYSLCRSKPKISEGKIYADEILRLLDHADPIEQMRSNLIHSIEQDKKMKSLMYRKMNVHQLVQLANQNDKGGKDQLKHYQQNIPRGKLRENNKEDKKNKGKDQNDYKIMITKIFARKEIEKDIKTTNYNKKLLNGLQIKNEIQVQIKNGISIIENYQQEPQSHHINQSLRRKQRMIKLKKTKTFQTIASVSTNVRSYKPVKIKSDKIGQKLYGQILSSYQSSRMKTKL